jgi:hypothetical protein
MNMVGQNDEATDEPMVSVTPSPEQRIHHGSLVQDPLAAFGADRHEDEGRLP